MRKKHLTLGPCNIWLRFIITISSVELAIMFGIYALRLERRFPTFFIAILDPLALGLITASLLGYLVIRPLLKHQQEATRDLKSACEENARLLKNVTTMHEVSKDILSELNTDALLGKIVDNARHLLDCRYAAIGVLNKQGEYEYFVPSGLDPLTFEGMMKRHGLPRGKGLLAHLLQEGKPLRLDDLSKHPASIGFPEGHPPMKSFLGIPISLGDKIIGRLFFADKLEGGGFTGEDEKIASTIANTAALAINNARLLNEIRSKKDDLEILNKLSLTLSSSLSVDDIVNQALDAVLNIGRLHIDKKGAFFLADEKTRTLNLAAYRGLTEEFARMEATVPFGECLCGLAADRGEDIISDDCFTDERHSRRYPAMRGHGHISLPLKSKGKVLGVLCLYLPAHMTLSDEEKILFRLMADIIAVNLESAISLRQISLFAHTLDSSNDGIAITDVEGVILHANPELLRQLGYFQDEFVGLHFSLMQSPHNPSGLGEKIFRNTLAEGWFGEVVNIRKDGSEYPALLTTSPVKDANGKTIALAGILRDITERKQTEEAIKRHSEELLALADASNVILTAVTTTGKLYEAICDIAVRKFGLRMVWLGFIEEGDYDVKPAAQSGFDDGYLASVKVTWDDSPTGMGPTGTAIKTKKPQVINDIRENHRYSLWREAALQKGFRSSMAIPMITSEGGIMGAINFYSSEEGFFTKDRAEVFRVFANQAATAVENARLVEGLEKKVAQRTRELEDANLELQTTNRELEMRRMEAEGAKLIAESADRAKSEFLANMSHELRTPLNAIMGFSEMMSRGMTGELTPKQQEYLRDIHESGSLLLSLINDILDLSKVEAGKMELEYGEMAVRETVERVLVLFREKTIKHGMKIITEIDERLGPVHADERRIRQVLLNLLSNAVKFTHDGGAVRVRARRAECGEQAATGRTDGECVEISVENEGPGIKAEDIPKLFKPFQQLDSIYNKKYHGTGLGLALCRRIVEFHGGRIWVESETGKTTKFTFLIPVRPIENS